MDDTNLIQVWLEEYKSLRNEIEQRQISIRYLVTLNIVALGTILGLVVSNIENNWLLLLIVPALGGILGMLTYINSRKISQLAHYIRFKIRPALTKLTHAKKILGWEDFVRDIEGEKFTLFKWFFHTGGVSLLSYFLPSVLAWGFVSKEALDSGAGWQVFWYLNILFIVILGYFLYEDRNYWFKKKLSDILHHKQKKS